MKQTRILPAVFLLLGIAAPLAAEEPETAPSLMERGAQMFLEGLLNEVEPALRDLEKLADELGPSFMDFASQMGPALTELLEKVEDWTAYHPPEVLPNGDIIIRRKTPADRIAEGEEIEI